MDSDGVRAAEGARNCPPLNSGSAVAPLFKRGVPLSQVTGHRSLVDFRIATGFARPLVEGDRTSSCVSAGRVVVGLGSVISRHELVCSERRMSYILKP